MRKILQKQGVEDCCDVACLMVLKAYEIIRSCLLVRF
jgi:hypothetical protein